MAKSFLRLDTRRSLADGTYPVVISVGHGSQLLLPTGIYAKSSDWDDASRLYIGKNAKSVNAVLRNALAGVVQRVIELKEAGEFGTLSKSELREALTHDKEQLERKKKNTIEEMFEAVAGTKAKRTGEIYRSTLVRLRSYQDISSLTFDDINKMWLDGFVASMSDLCPNTKSIHLRNLRAVNNYALDCEFTSNYPFRRYRMPTTTVRKKSFSAEVIRRISTLDLGRNGVYRDIFMLTFYLIGINFVDLCGLREVSDGRVDYRRAKTHKPYSIKVEPEAEALIKKLRGEGQLLMMLDSHVDYRSYYNQLARGLRKVRSVYNAAYPDEPISELTTYWARHSWATIAAHLDIPKETIAAALGHDMGNDTTAIYIDFDRSKVDEANRRVIDYVMEN